MASRISWGSRRMSLNQSQRGVARCPCLIPCGQNRPFGLIGGFQTLHPHIGPHDYIHPLHRSLGCHSHRHTLTTCLAKSSDTAVLGLLGRKPQTKCAGSQTIRLTQFIMCLLLQCLVDLPLSLGAAQNFTETAIATQANSILRGGCKYKQPKANSSKPENSWVILHQSFNSPLSHAAALQRKQSLRKPRILSPWPQTSLP